MSWLMPDAMFRTYDEITPEWLTAHGIRAILSDIDNTLAPYEQPEPDEKLRAWIDALRGAGITVALISNNERERVELFNRSLGLTAYWKSGKPFRKYLVRAMKDMGSDKHDTAILGDQLLTDALAGKHIGLKALIVPPIKDKTTLFFRFKRLCEKPFIRRFKKKHGIDW
ncbi:MAG: YqeG family HAD IIIA-type phosphatase [Clostridia bacterium]|nr:YqeG family HAD IIIA-type phosphatase [Clostridia bacterium]